MATIKVGSATVSYGIGVQNRYSAFLDDEDGFSSPTVLAAISSARRAEQQQQAAAKQKAHSAAHKAGNVTATSGKANGAQRSAPSGVTNKAKSEQTADQKYQTQRAHQDGKRPRAVGQQQGSANANQSMAPNRLNANRQGNNNQDYTANSNNKFSRTQSNGNQNHQSTSSQHQQNSKENNDVSNHNQGKSFSRNNINNQRPSNRQRQFQSDNDQKSAHYEDGNANGALNNNFEEEKRRRQQKRALDMKHKDPEKRDARRSQQASATERTDDQQGNANPIDGPGQKGFKGRRQQVGDKNVQEGDAIRGPRGVVGAPRGRGRRPENGLESEGGENRDGPRTMNQRGERPQRNRNGFGVGSRGSRGSRGEEHVRQRRDSEGQKPIPNFSDKLDFPSLAS